MSVIHKVEQELRRARNTYQPMHSIHEGYAILREEVDELWDLIKRSKGMKGTDSMRVEAIQVAAMAMRFIEDLCEEET